MQRRNRRTLDKTGTARKTIKNKKKKKGEAQHEVEKKNKDYQENRNVNEAADNSDTPQNSDCEWMEQDHREDQGLQGEASSHSGVGEASEAMVPTVKRKKRKAILRSKQ